LQDVAALDEDGVRKIWSESHVSEGRLSYFDAGLTETVYNLTFLFCGTDFDVSLRLQVGGYITRWATYSAGGFKEGVSLTINDEMYGTTSSSSTRHENADVFCTVVDGKNTLTGVANSYSAPFDTGIEDRFPLSSRDLSGLLCHSIARSAFYPMSSATTRLRVDSP
jgi:hypothetical protein